MEKIYLSYQDYNYAINRIFKEIKKIENIHIISIYRGSLGIGVHLSNLLNAPLSILKFQTRDGDKHEKLKMIYNAGIKKDDNLIVVDDIYDTGKTLKEVKKYLKTFFPKNKAYYFTIFGRPNNDSINFIFENKGKWVNFPWEIIEENY